VIGFAFLLGIGVAAFAAMWLLGLPRALRMLAAAALLLGAAGYAWQGRPGLAGTRAQPQVAAVELDPALIDLRGRLTGRFTAEGAYFIASDALLRAGNPQAAARVMLGGASALPDNFILWTGAGDAIARRDGAVTPAARLAFGRAFQLAPRHPAPPFFLGLAYARSGELARTRALWRRAVALSPERATYRRDIARLLAVVEMQVAAGQGRP
jgi:cytochrome c-type biogenesis protein CcmH